MAQGVLLFGAARGTGLEAAKILVAAGHPVTAFVRPSSDRSALEVLGVGLVTGDVLDAAAVEAAFASGPFDAVVNTIGGRRGEPRPDFDGVKNIVDAARAAGVERMVLVTAVGAGDSRDTLAPKAWEVLGPVIELKTKGEDYLIDSGLRYTILRPGGMNSDPATGTAILTEDHTAMGTITRADLARLVVDCLEDENSVGRIFHAIDPGIESLPPLQRGRDLPQGSGRR